MNKSTRLVAILLASIIHHLPSAAQLQEGHIYAGGVFEMKHDQNVNPPRQPGQSKTGYWNTQAIILPQAGIALSSTVELGAGVGYSMRVEKERWYESGNFTKINAGVRIVMLNMYARAYRSFSEKLGVYGELSLTGGKGKKTWQRIDDFHKTEADGNAREISISAGPGLYFKAGKRTLLDIRFLKASYVTRNETMRDDASRSFGDITSSKLDISFLKTVSIGFRVVL